MSRGEDLTNLDRLSHDGTRSALTSIQSRRICTTTEVRMFDTMRLRNPNPHKMLRIRSSGKVFEVEIIEFFWSQFYFDMDTIKTRYAISQPVLFGTRFH
jgi:hypothetical protein